MKYDPKKAVACLPKGEYAATVEKADETESKAGNQMIVLTFCVYAPGDKRYVIKEHIVEASLWKLKRLAKAINVMEAFESGEFNPVDYVGKNLTVVLDIEEDDEFGDKNKITRYKPLMHPIPAGVNREPVAVSDGEVPF